MRVDVNTGLMAGVKQVLSPFFDERPSGVMPHLIVLHGISLPPGDFGGPWIARFFANLPARSIRVLERAALRVSAHLLRQRGGSSVYLVNERHTHADPPGRARRYNDCRRHQYEGTDDLLPIAQYHTLFCLPMLLGACPQIARAGGAT
jgi:AmpD protein